VFIPVLSFAYNSCVKDMELFDPRPVLLKLRSVWATAMSLQPQPQLAATVEMLKEAFESGRSVTLRVGDCERPISGCVSYIHEGAAAGDYLFSAFVGRERVVFSHTDAQIETPGNNN
jgi:hypothetical protein